MIEGKSKTLCILKKRVFMKKFLLVGCIVGIFSYAHAMEQLPRGNSIYYLIGKGLLTVQYVENNGSKIVPALPKEVTIENNEQLEKKQVIARRVGIARKNLFQAKL